MKTTTIGRIGAIIAGAAMLGTAVASALTGAAAVDSNLTKGFFFDDNMNPQVQIVVGEKGAASDGAAAGQIAAMIGNMAFTTTTTSAPGGTAESEAQTVSCTAGDIACSSGNATAEGAVTLSWEAIGLVGELEQKEMDCDIYNSSEDGMLMTSLDNGGDSGTFCDGSDDWTGYGNETHSSYFELYTPEDTVGTTLIGACKTTAGSNVNILSEGTFDNQICTICYNYCDVALGCEPHKMSEWVELACDQMKLKYDCDTEGLVMNVDDAGIVYNVFTDDILMSDIEDDSSTPKLVGQSYLGKIILGQNEYYVEDLDEDQMTIACGDTGTATTSAAMEYTAPAEGSACDAADSDQTYSIKLVGAQTIEEKGVVDVTLEVTRPDGTTEQVTSGISGTPVVGDVKIKLQKGTAASNVITGDQSFSADLLVWYVPSEKTFEDDEKYTEEGVKDDDGIWKLDFNAGNDVTVANVEGLEDGSYLYDNDSGAELPDGVEENDQWTSCYKDVSSDDEDEQVLRNLQFELSREDNTELPEGDMIQLPFNDGKYLLSDLKFGYQGLMDENFLSDDMVDTTDIVISMDDISLVNESDDNEKFYRKVTIDYVDEWGDQMSDVRLDEGPFEENDKVLVNGEVYDITDIGYNDAGDGALIEYKLKDGADWTDYKQESGVNDCGSKCGLVLDSTWSGNASNFTVMSAVAGIDSLNMSPGWYDNGTVGDALWIIRNMSSASRSSWELWIDKDLDNVLEMARTDTVKTEFDDDVEFSADGSTVTISGNQQAGAEDNISVKLNDSAYLDLGCSDYEGTCDDYTDGSEDGTLVSLSGATVTVDADEIEEPENSNNDTDAIVKVSATVPKDELRPTIFFGLESALNTSQVTITDAEEGTVVNVGGVDVTVEDFGVTGSVSGGTVVSGGETTVECPAQPVTCPDVSVETQAPANIGYQLVVVEGSESAAKNLVLIGGPSVNSLTKDLTTVDDVCAAPIVKLASSNRLLVAGCEAADTQSAATALETWLKANV